MSVQLYLPQVSLCLCWEVGEENACQLPYFQRSPQTCSEISMHRSVSFANPPPPPPRPHPGIVIASCVGCWLFKGGNPAVTHPSSSPSSEQLAFKASVSSSWFYKHRIQHLWFLKPNAMGIGLPCVSSLVWGPISLPSLCPAPALLQAAFLCLSDLLNLSDTVASLHLVMELVLPVFCSLSGLLIWR